MLDIEVTVSAGSSLHEAAREASLLAVRIGCDIRFNFNGDVWFAFKSGQVPIRMSKKTKCPKFRYVQQCGELHANRAIEGIHQDRSKHGYFIAESMSEGTARVIAEALGGEFIGTAEFEETF